MPTVHGPRQGTGQGRTARQERAAASGRAAWPSLLLFLALSFAAAAVGALSSSGSGAVYASLDRPSWAPPSWLFGPVWTVLYALVGTSAWLVQRARGRRARTELGLWGVQLLLNAAWTPLFFGARQYGLAFADVCLLLLTAGATAVLFRRVRPAAGYLLVPYLLWVAFAAALNLSIWVANT
ncbi:TspO/MBR family protein [Streptomyces thermolineatus]|uniref:TspO/MBR family protein n=1 Tax=Streptomyces thermolineatus TaxID=44033 RepID=UPI00384D34AD